MFYNGSSYWILLHCCIGLVSSFNIDTIHPLVYEDPLRSVNQRRSYFGYSVQFLFEKANDGQWTKWIMVGAPRANSTYEKHKDLLEPGQVYRCSLGNVRQDRCQQLMIENAAEDYNHLPELYYKARKDYGWLGGSIGVADPRGGRLAVCSHRWANRITKGHYLMNGACYWSDHNVSTTVEFDKTIPLVNRERQSRGVFNYAYGQAGMSLQMIRDPKGMEQMIIGAPGVYNWTGTIVLVNEFSTIFTNAPEGGRLPLDSTSSGFGQRQILNVTQLPQFLANEYLGYSVSSGVFFDDGKLLYVSGAPRAAKMKGKVYLLELVNDVPSDIPVVRAELEGAQIGAYFGASVLGLKFSGDGGQRSDVLLAGAPMNTARPYTPLSSADEGSVDVYRNTDGVLKREQILYGSGARDARFGSTIATMGDINLDSYEDVVIGAPYEDGQGAVYVYLGGPFKLLFRQRIAAADLHHPLDGLTGFGISLNAADIDDNGYPDLAVGSYLSSQVVIFRSQPIIRLDLRLSADVDRIDPNGGSLSITACAFIGSRTPLPAQLCAGYSLEVDVTYQPYPRLHIVDDDVIGRSYTANYTEIHTQKSLSVCRSFRVRVETTSGKEDFATAATFRLTGWLMKNPAAGSTDRRCRPLDPRPPASGTILVGKQKNVVDAFCSDCPVMDVTSPSVAEKSVAFAADCGVDNVCTAHLQVLGHFQQDEEAFVIGSRRWLRLAVNVTNYGEPSYGTRLQLRLPPGAALRLPAAECLSTGDPLALGRQSIYSCPVRPDPLKFKRTVWMNLELDVGSMRSGAETLSVDIDVVNSDANRNDSGRISKLQLNVSMATEIDVVAVGHSIKEQQFYRLINGSSGNVAFQHHYEMTNLLASVAHLVDIEVFVPAEMTVAGSTLAILRLESLRVSQNGVPVLCQPNSSVSDPSEILQLRHPHSGSPPNSNSTHRRYATTSTTFNATTTTTTTTTTIDCSAPGVRCWKTSCRAAELSNHSRIAVDLNATLFVKDVGGVGGNDAFRVYSHAQIRIVDPANVVQPELHKLVDAFRFTFQGPLISDPVRV